MKKYPIVESLINISSTWCIRWSLIPSLTFLQINILSILILRTARLWYSQFEVLYVTNISHNITTALPYTNVISYLIIILCQTDNHVKLHKDVTAW